MELDELKKEAEEYTKNLLKRLGIKEDMLLENQPKYLRHESMNFVALDVENVTDAYLASAEPREKRIAELEEKISVLLSCKNCPENKGGLICAKEYENKCLAQKIQFIKELQQENAILKGRTEGFEKQILGLLYKYESVYKRFPDLKSAMDKAEEVLKENANLKEELKKWKDEWQEQVQKATDEGYARTLQTIQLSKAKEIIKKFSEFVNNEVEYDPEHPQEHTDLWNELCEEAEQFIKDSEVKE